MKRGWLMNLIAEIALCFMGGVAAIIVLRLVMFHFWDRSHKRGGDEQYLKRIADSLQ
jgi:hypothetical protein